MSSEQKERRRFAMLSIPAAWLPPVLAALVCGLQLTFWEHATVGSSQFYTGGSNEMFDLLLFAYVTRCLLEFRVDQRESWLIRGTFVYGAAMTNNWAMIGFFPLFPGRLRLAQRSELLLFATAGPARLEWCGRRYCFYLLLPLVRSLSDSAPRSRSGRR